MRKPTGTTTAVILLAGLAVGLGPSGSIASVAHRTSATAAVADACRAADAAGECALVSEGRELIARDIAEYTYELQVGPTEHDRIVVHRIVRETADGVPIATPETVFLAHGDLWGFGPALAGDIGHGRRKKNIATYLARHDVDVWGSDRRWVLVEKRPADFDFMRGWDTTMDVEDLRVATSLQRSVRALSGDGDGQTPFLGWSRGAELAYTLANYETHLPVEERNVSAIIPVDIALRYAPEDDQYRLHSCAFYRAAEEQIEHGHYQWDNRYWHRSGKRALHHPDEPSDVYPGMTNLEALLFDSSHSFEFYNAWNHFVGAPDVDQPTDLSYSRTRRYVHMVVQASKWSSQGNFAQGNKIFCGEDDPLVDNLDAVTVPVLYVAAAGGFGTTGNYSTTLLGSTDVTLHLVRTLPPGQERQDYGHVDLWTGSDAKTLVWAPVLDWLHAH